MTYKITRDKPDKKSVYEFRETWDEQAIRTAIQTSHESGIPLFELSKVELQPVKICQLDCPWCFGRYLRMPEKEGSRTPAGDVFLALDKLENNLFRPLHERHVNPVFMLAGLYSDPLAYPLAAELMRTLGRYHFRFGLYTNGIGLKDDVIDAIVESAGLRNGAPSYVSLDVGALMMVKRFEEIYPKIQRLTKRRNPATLQINAPIVLNEHVNWDEPIALERVHAMLMEVGVDAIRYNFSILPIKPEQQKMIDRVLQLEAMSGGRAKLDTKPFKRCYVMTQSLSVHASGKVYPCSQTCSAAFDALSFGDLNEESILDIWQGPKHKERFQHFDPSRSYCRCNVGDLRFNEFAGDADSLT